LCLNAGDGQLEELEKNLLVNAGADSSSRDE
jgi:hypothetical protein